MGEGAEGVEDSLASASNGTATWWPLLGNDDQLDGALKAAAAMRRRRTSNHPNKAKCTNGAQADGLVPVCLYHLVAKIFCPPVVQP